MSAAASRSVSFEPKAVRAYIKMKICSLAGVCGGQINQLKFKSYSVLAEKSISGCL